MAVIASRSIAPQRFNLLLITVFGVTALSLALVGVYGVMSHGVAQQLREIGVRLALGARGSDVTRLIVGQGLRLAAFGAVLGAGLFVALSGVLQGWLYEVSARDPMVFAGSLLILMGTAFVASYLPARRAAAVDPIAALRAE